MSLNSALLNNVVPHLQLLVCQVLPELFGHSLYVLERDLACLVVIKQTESFQDLLFGILLGLKLESMDSGFTTN